MTKLAYKYLAQQPTIRLYLPKIYVMCQVHNE